MAIIKESELRKLKLAQSVNDFNQLLAWLSEDGEIIVVDDPIEIEEGLDAESEEEAEAEEPESDPGDPEDDDVEEDEES